MPREEQPSGSAASPEERRAALEAGDDVFDEGTTDNSAASMASPEDLEAARVAEEELKKSKEEEGSTEESEESDPSQNEKLAEALNNLAASLPKKETPAPKQLTQEELDAALNKYEVSDELLAKLDNPETRKEALREIAGGAAKEGATLATILMNEQMGELRNQIAPILHAQAQAQLEKQRNDFLSEYPALNDEAFTPIIEIAAAQLQKEGKVPKTVTEARQLLAERAGGLIKKVNPAFDVKAKSAQQKQATQKTTTVPRQATGTPKAGGGGGGGSSKTATPAERNRSAGVEVFD